MTKPTLFEATRPRRGHDVVPGCGVRLQATFTIHFPKIDAVRVLDHEKHHGNTHFDLRGDQGAVGGPRVPAQGHQTMQIIKYFTESVHKTNPTNFFRQPNLKETMMLFLAMGNNFRTM